MRFDFERPEFEPASAEPPRPSWLELLFLRGRRRADEQGPTDYVQVGELDGKPLYAEVPRYLFPD